MGMFFCRVFLHFFLFLNVYIQYIYNIFLSTLTVIAGMFFGYRGAGTMIFLLIYPGEEYCRRMNEWICVQGTTLIRERTFVQLECEFFWTDDGRLLSSESR